MTARRDRDRRTPRHRGDPLALRRAVRLAALLTLLTCGLAASGPAAAAPPLSWSSAHVDGNNSAALVGVSCASLSLCVAVDDRADVSSSTDPTGGARAWSTAPNVPAPFLGVSCPTSSLCVAGTESGIHASTNPTGDASAWPLEALYVFPPELCLPGSEFAPCFGPLASVSCTSPSLCVASLNSEDDFNELLTTTEPLGGESAWNLVQASQIHGQARKVPPPYFGPAPILSVSCVSSALCLATDAAGNLLSSTDPSSSESSWTIAPLDDKPLWGLSCASAALCVAVDAAGNILTSTNPTGNAGDWSIANVDGANLLRAVSCASTTLCVAVDTAGNILTSTNPTGGTNAWSIARVDTGHALNSVSCAAAALCVAVDDAGNALTATLPAPAGGPEGEPPHGGGGQGGNGPPAGPLPGGTPPPQPQTSGKFAISDLKPGHDGQIALTLNAPAAGAIDAKAATTGGETAGSLRGRTLPNTPRSGKIPYAASSTSASGPAVLKVTLKPTRSALRRLRHAHSLRLQIKVTFSPHGGSATTASRFITVPYHPTPHRRAGR